MNETDRIIDYYKFRDSYGKEKLYSLLNTSSLFHYHSRERKILETIKAYGIGDLSCKQILEVGCGTGWILRDFIKYGAKPENCFGIDLLPGRIETARKLSPNIDFRCANAESLPYESDFFDIILSFTVFTSILDKNMRQNIAKSMLNVLKPEGIILWYDYHVNNPSNPNVRGVKKKEIYKLFPDCKIYLKRTTLAPPIARALAPYSIILCQILEKIPLLCTHYLGLIKKSKLIRGVYSTV